MSDRAVALALDHRQKGFTAGDLKVQVDKLLENQEVLQTLAALGGAPAEVRNPVQLGAFALQVVTKLLREERALDAIPGGAQERYGPAVMSALAARGLDSAEGRTLVRVQALAAGQTLADFIQGRTKLSPAWQSPAVGGRTEEQDARTPEQGTRVERQRPGQERVEAWAIADLTAMRDAMFLGRATPEEMGRFLKKIDLYRLQLGEERFWQLLDRVFGNSADEVRGWLDFRDAFVAGKKEYWYQVITDGKAAADEWDRNHYQPLREQRDAGLLHPIYGALVQAIQNEAVAIHDAYASLYRAKEGWMQAYLQGQPTEPFAAQGAAARERLAELDPMGERLWQASNQWYDTAVQFAQVEQFRASYAQLLEGLIAGDASRVNEAHQALASVYHLFGTVPHKELWNQYQDRVRAAYLQAVDARASAADPAARAAAEARIELFRGALGQGILQQWEHERAQRDQQERLFRGLRREAVGFLGGNPYKEIPVRDYVPLPLLYPLAPGTYTVTDRAGLRIHPVTGQEKVHYGTDLGAAQGTKIFAAHSGEVVEAGYDSGYGYYVVLKGPDGLHTLYAHMMKKPEVAVGQRVTAGDVLGFVGSTGVSTGPHLHFEVYRVRGDGSRVYFRAEDVCIRSLAELGTGIDGVVQAWRVLYGLTPEEEMAVRISATYEGTGGFANLAGNFDGQGVSFGFAQWNLGQGTLQSEILRPLLRDHPEIFYRHFPNSLTLQVGNRKYTMAEIINLSGAQLQAVLPVIGREVMNPNSRWHKAFKDLAGETVVMRLQLQDAKRMLDLAKKEMTSDHYILRDGSLGAAKSWKVSSPQALALLYDVRKQNGSFYYAWDAIEAGLRKQRPASEQGLLRYLAWHVANSSNPNWKSDVWSRKIAIVEGGGVVHGTRLEFDWERYRMIERGSGSRVQFPQWQDPMAYLRQ